MLFVYVALQVIMADQPQTNCLNHRVGIMIYHWLRCLSMTESVDRVGGVGCGIFAVGSGQCVRQ